MKFDIDKSLRKACEDVIIACSYPIYDPLEIWVNQVNAANGPTTKASFPTSAASTQNASRSKISTVATAPNLGASAPHAQAEFFEALQRDLRPLVSKVKLYLDDARTVEVLLEHVVGRIEVMYERFGNAMFKNRSRS